MGYQKQLFIVIAKQDAEGAYIPYDLKFFDVKDSKLYSEEDSQILADVNFSIDLDDYETNKTNIHIKNNKSVDLVQNCWVDNNKIALLKLDQQKVKIYIGIEDIDLKNPEDATRRVGKKLRLDITPSESSEPGRN